MFTPVAKLAARCEGASAAGIVVDIVQLPMIVDGALMIVLRPIVD